MTSKKTLKYIKTFIYVNDLVDDLTDLQNKEFEILKIFVEICEKLNIKYYLVCGSVLGAVKYKGFIPWDDDIDVGMYRKEYERFCAEAPKYLPEYYFLQTWKTEPNFPYIFAKIRDLRTTFIEKSNAELNIHHGVYIDIFPLDGFPKDESEQKALVRKKIKLDFKKACVFKVNENYSVKAKVLMKLERILGYHKRVNSIVAEIESLISKWDVEDSQIICNHGNWQKELEYANKEQYSEGIYVSFEGLKVRIPKNYDDYLTQKYGDWRADLPEEKKKGHHFYEVCDLERPYTDYIEVISKDKIRLK